MPTPDVSTLLERQERQLAHLSDIEARRLIRAFEDARRDTLDQLFSTGAPALERRNLRALVARLEVARVALMRRFDDVLQGTERRALQRAERDLVQVVRAAGTTADLAAVNANAARMASRLADYENLALHRFSTDRYSAKFIRDVQRVLVSGVLQGQSQSALSTRIRGAAGPFTLLRSQADLIARMELSRAYNDGAVEQLLVLHAEDGRWLKRIVEILDERNHPFSRVSNGMVTAPGVRFRVPVADVVAAGASMGRGIGGILWAVQGNAYVGRTLPAHFGERGRVVPWHATWRS